MQKNFVKLTLFPLLTFATLQLVACGAEKSARQNQRSLSVDTLTNPTNESQTDDVHQAVNKNPDVKPIGLADIPVAVGVRNFAQINETMSVLTGVSPNNTVIAASYTELSTQLPLTNDIRSFVASHQVATTKLAVEYCDQLFENAALRSRAVPGFNFAATPATAFTPQNKDLVVTALLDNFWGKDLDNRPTNDSTKPELVILLNNILQGKNQNTVALTRNAVKGVCTAVLASAPVLFY